MKITQCVLVAFILQVFAANRQAAAQDDGIGHKDHPNVKAEKNRVEGDLKDSRMTFLKERDRLLEEIENAEDAYSDDLDRILVEHVNNLKVIEVERTKDGDLDGALSARRAAEKSVELKNDNSNLGQQQLIASKDVASMQAYLENTAWSWGTRQEKTLVFKPGFRTEGINAEMDWIPLSSEMVWMKLSEGEGDLFLFDRARHRYRVAVSPSLKADWVGIRRNDR